jgi:serine/threonine protein phosphatase PrpC
MEDRNYVELKFFYDYDLFCVFDGHGSDEVAKFLRLYFKDILRNEMVQEPDETIALKNAFRKMDSLIPKNIGFMSGSTGLVILRRGRDMWVANAGDCRCIMNENTDAKDITIDHKPNLKSEYERITSLGGKVLMDPFGIARVNGNLAVSRSFGDFYLKPYVSSEPDVFQVNITDSNRIIFAASDGVWDVFNGTEIINIFFEENQINSSDPKAFLRNASNKILSTARNRGSGDNITILVILQLV